MDAAEASKALEHSGLRVTKAKEKLEEARLFAAQQETEASDQAQRATAAFHAVEVRPTLALALALALTLTLTFSLTPHPHPVPNPNQSHEQRSVQLNEAASAAAAEAVKARAALEPHKVLLPF